MSREGGERVTPGERRTRVVLIGCGNQANRAIYPCVAPGGLEALAPLSIANASEVAFQAIRRAIIDGRLAPGERLREVALGQRFGVSATPVREALARLQAEGLIAFEPRRGAVVPTLGPADVAEVYELRELLEAFAARRAAQRHADPAAAALLERLTAIVEEAEPHARAPDMAEYNRLDVELHQTLVALGGNRRVARVFHGVHAQVQAVRLRAIQLPGRPARSQEEHHRLVAAIRRGDADSAEADARHHIASVKQDVLARLSRAAVSSPASGVRSEARSRARAESTRSGASSEKVMPVTESGGGSSPCPAARS
jgi:DNA-binding GntR family transcriptional regulator